MVKSGLISVVIPVYNSEKYINKLLESINNQVYKNFELIIIDDGSTDSSLVLIKEYLQNTNIRFEIVSQSNSGPSAARNVGIEKAKGEWMAFIDSDDLLHPEFLSSLFKIVKKFDADCSFCGTEYFLDNSEFKLNMNLNQELIYKKLDLDRMVIELAIAKKKTGHCNMLYKKSVIDTFNLRYPTNYKYGEDLEFLLKYLCHSTNVVELENKLFLQRMRSQSLTSRENISVDLEPYIYNSIETKERVKEYIGKVNNRYFDKFGKYIVPRVILSLVKNLALFSDDSTYIKFITKIEAKKSMRTLILYPNIMISVNAIIFSLSPTLYRFFLRKILLKSGVN